MEEKRASFFEHLEELRRHLIRSIIYIAVAGTGGFYFYNRLIWVMEFPLRKHLEFMQRMPYLRYIDVKNPVKLVFITPAEAIWVALKLGFLAGFVVVLPLVLYELWLFLKPSLYPNERQYVRIFVIGTGGLFIIGGLFSFFILLPFAVNFLLTFASNLVPMLSIGAYMDFCLKFMFAFGLVFEMPLAILILVAIGIITPQTLAKQRKIAIVGAFILGAILSPTPDVFNQTLIAVPLYALYEIGISLSMIYVRRRHNKGEAGSQ